MITVLEAPDIRSRVVPIAVETYHWMIESGLVLGRAELIRGVIVEKMSKSSLREFLANAIFRQLSDALGDNYFVRKEGPITLADSEPEPDVSVVRGRNEDYRDGHPRTAVLAVEIAITSESSDREMIKAYAEAGVEECWLVLAKKRIVEWYSEPVDGAYRRCSSVTAGEVLESTALPGVSLKTGELFS